MMELIFEVETPLGFVVRCSWRYWTFIVAEKHPVMKGHEREVELALVDPDEIRRSRQDENVFLFYRGKTPRWLCAVTRRNDKEGFLITAYPTDAIKAGDRVWTRSE